jgi:hypothetical protein
LIGTPRYRLLLQVGLASPSSARAAWARVEPALDLDDEGFDGYELLPLIGYRLAELAIDHPARRRLSGLVRRTWMATELELSRLVPAGPVGGRLATVLAYLPAPGVVDLVPGDRALPGWATTMPGRLGDADVAVADPASQLTDSLLRGRWVDATFAARHPSMDWSMLGRHGRPDVRGPMRRLERALGEPFRPGRSPLRRLLRQG